MVRASICFEVSPLLYDFDNDSYYTNLLGCQGENPATTQCIFSSQLGQGRTTLGMTVACIVKAVLMSTKLNKMVETGTGSPEWAENIIKKVMVVMMMNNVH